MIEDFLLFFFSHANVNERQPFIFLKGRISLMILKVNKASVSQGVCNG